MLVVSLKRLAIVFAAVALVAGGCSKSSRAQSTLQANQTAGFGKGQLFTFTYTQNFDCIDMPTEDLNYNNILAESDPSELQIPICQIGNSATMFDPTGAQLLPTPSSNASPPLYVLVPFFSTDNDTNVQDAIPCPTYQTPGLVCGPALGEFLVKNFGAVVEADKTTPAVAVQCPGPDGPVGTCTMHGDRVDLGPLLAQLKVIPSPVSQNVFTPLPNHSHLINTDFTTTPEWWQVIAVLVLKQEYWPNAAGTSGITSYAALQAAIQAGAAVQAPSNFFLFFGSQPS